MRIRDEGPGDHKAIAEVTRAAFARARHSNGQEAAIIERLRASGALLLSLVVEEEGQIVAHAAFSAVRIGGRDLGWVGLGPISVTPARQGQGIGRTLLREGLHRLRLMGLRGCVVLGDPLYYARFGFARSEGLSLAGVPPEAFMQLRFSGPAPSGAVTYAAAFDPA
ncbi:N-acetyltransferase [Pseudooceanicola sp. CBS1P-1]|uniref:GNAT family N-acetyltransferase n=1 Tax=Pseudooceanicola albus TaxID=2692189 RepID=A0A6L7G123_9RHOB|nr:MULTISPECIES: N-acetyltransferase [Pseudooceanicola]MBT9384961.1 N-acetyltransferase [Pseudooceanicola endophyticus]MXN18044.1 GNAT family N-acetyltransferase [Pseudooceanicola albus]